MDARHATEAGEFACAFGDAGGGGCEGTECDSVVELRGAGVSILVVLMEGALQPRTEVSWKWSGAVVRCSLETPWLRVSYYSTHDRQAILSLMKLKSVVDRDLSMEWIGEEKDCLVRTLIDTVQSRSVRENQAEEARHQASLPSLTEEIRQLLVEALYMDLVRAGSHWLSGEKFPLDFSEEASQRLKQPQVPFAGVLRDVGLGLPKPCRDDPRYLCLRELKGDVLTRRFEAIRAKLMDRLRELMTMQHETPTTVKNNAMSPSAVSLVYFAATASVTVAAMHD